MLDIDDFKFLNDRYGHPHGDAVIQRVAQILSDRRPATAPIASAATSSPPCCRTPTARASTR